MIENQIGEIFTLIASIIGFIIGTIATIFPEKLHKHQTDYAKKQSNQMSQDIARKLSEQKSTFPLRAIGLVFIIANSIIILRYFNVL